jgi:hypothetical protein
MILAESYSTSSGVPGIVWSLAIAGLFAWRGHRAAVEVERLHGRPPYGWEPVTWSIICFCTVLFGRLLLAAGASRERNRMPSSYAAVPQRTASPTVRAQAAPDLLVFAPVAPVAPVATVPAPVPAAGPPAGWHPDPSGKYQHRWWDGQRWTAHVGTNGVVGKDV